MRPPLRIEVRMTGRCRVRPGWFGRMILQLELRELTFSACPPKPGTDPAAWEQRLRAEGVTSYRWRDATWDDMHALERLDLVPAGAVEPRRPWPRGGNVTPGPTHPRPPAPPNPRGGYQPIARPGPVASPPSDPAGAALPDQEQRDVAEQMRATVLGFATGAGAPAEVQRETDGELLIDWSPGPGRMVTLSLRADGRLSYAFTWDDEKAHGTAQMPDRVPAHCACPPSECHGEGVHRCRWCVMEANGWKRPDTPGVTAAPASQPVGWMDSFGELHKRREDAWEGDPDSTPPRPVYEGTAGVLVDAASLDTIPTSWELSHGSDDEEEQPEWCVHRRHGSVNDREWTLLGRGPTPSAAIAAARGVTGPQ